MAKKRMEDCNYVCNIRKLRKEKNMSQTGLAIAAELETSTVTRAESGQTDPTATTLFAIAKALDVNVSDLYTDKDSEEYQLELTRSREEDFFRVNKSYSKAICRRRTT